MSIAVGGAWGGRNQSCRIVQYCSTDLFRGHWLRGIWEFRRTGHRLARLTSLGGETLKLAHQQIQITIMRGKHLLSRPSDFFDDRVFIGHGRSSFNCCGVQITGELYPAAMQISAIALCLVAFARWRQFHVKRYLPGPAIHG